MTTHADEPEEASRGGARIRLKGVVDPAEAPLAAAAPARIAPGRRTSLWNAASRQTMLVTRLMAALFFVAVLAGWPLGKLLAWRRNTGSFDGWSYFDALDLGAFLLGVFVPLLTILVGYIMSRQQQMISAAEEIAEAAQQFIQPSESAAENARSVGLVVRGQMDALNAGLDGALGRLASVEAMIRKHVAAIEAAGGAVETRASGAVSRVAEERVRLIELTEHLNAQADGFARAIAEKARASIDALASAEGAADRAEAELQARLQRLDEAATRALASFNALSGAIVGANESLQGAAGGIDAAAAAASAASDRAAKAARAAADSAAQNAANVGASAARAAEEAKRAADAAIETATREAERASRASFEAAEREAQRVAETANRLIGVVQQSTAEMFQSVTMDAQRTAAAAAAMSEAAQKSAEASARASSDVVRASDQARKDAEDALARAAETTGRAELRNRALNESRAALEAENARLEALIDEQRKRADRLADAIAAQTDRLSKLAEAQLREQEAAAALAAAALKAREEELARAEAQRKADAEAAERAQSERRARAEAAAREEAERRAAAAEAQRRKDEAARAESERLTLVERAMKDAKPADGVLDLGPTARAKKTARKTPAGEAAPAPEASNVRHGPEAPLTLGAEDKRPAAKRPKRSVSWREILDAADEAEPLDLRAAENGSDSIRIIGELQRFTLELESRLYGEPPSALKERFDRGDRNIFANRLLRLNESDVKRRIRMETERDRAFDKDIHGFLQGFERLLEDATASDKADENLEEYLSSPLGRVYLLIGAMVGYFA